MSALYDQLEQQARLLSVEERAKLALILIEELDSLLESNVEQLWIAEANEDIKPTLRVKSLYDPAMRSCLRLAVGSNDWLPLPHTS
jgi:hypothetical protein